MKIWTISDTHTKHLELELPDHNEIDMVIHAGDASSTKDTSFNEAEMREFLQWFDSLPYKYKIYIPGNHDTSIQAGMFNFEEHTDIIFLIHESVEIEGIKIFGSPYTPSFGIGWAYNISRHKIDNYWELIPDNTDIIVTHGPPKGIMDYTAEGHSVYTQTGCKALLNNIKLINPKYHIFGHLHDEDNVLNCGTFKPNNDKADTTYVNACTMNLSYNIVNNGIIIEV
jgi:Icc-related predicted phosphoesterase